MNLAQFKKLLNEAPDDFDISSLLPAKTETVVCSLDIPTEIPVDTPVTTVKHTPNLGDIIASLIAVKKYHEITGRKVRYLQKVDTPAMYYQGAVHPTRSDDGVQVTMNTAMFGMIKPLVESQSYIESFVQYDGQGVDIDFDVIRGKTFVNLPNGSIQAWLFYAFPDLASDISKPWVTLDATKRQIEEVTKGKIIINFTERYRRTVLDYFFLKDYAPDLLFSGTEQEHFKFCKQWGLNIPRLEIKDFLELAYAIRGCRFTLSNQSFLWNLAEAMKIPRILEVCEFAPNCMPFYGEDSYGYFHQTGLHYYFRMLYRKTMGK